MIAYIVHPPQTVDGASKQWMGYNETCPTCNENEDQSDEGQNWVTCVVCDSWYLVKCVTDSPNLQLSLEEDENVFVRCLKCKDVDVSGIGKMRELFVEKPSSPNLSSELKSSWLHSPTKTRVLGQRLVRCQQSWKL